MDEALVKSTLQSLAEQFNVTVEYLLPKMRDYEMAIDSLGFLIAGSISLAILIAFVFFGILPAVKKLKDGYMECFDIFDDGLFGLFMFALIELLPVGMTIFFVFDYIGWKYAPEIKLMEYVVRMIK